jgi:hypothetical protein
VGRVSAATAENAHTDKRPEQNGKIPGAHDFPALTRRVAVFDIFARSVPSRTA